MSATNPKISPQSNTANFSSLPKKQGLYDPAMEKDSCGIGFVCNLKGISDHSIVRDANSILCQMAHRGGTGYDEHTGDGSGILTGIPKKFLAQVATESGITLPEFGKYGTGIVFLPQNSDYRQQCKQLIGQRIVASGMTLLGWRQVPINPEKSNIGIVVRECMPCIEQLFIGAPENLTDNLDFERQLYMLRKHTTHFLNARSELQKDQAPYFCSLSSKTIVYKGMLTPAQLFVFYSDLCNADYKSHLAMVHSRFSTNTFPSWSRAQPQRMICHNGEINTLLGNKNSMLSRQHQANSPVFNVGTTGDTTDNTTGINKLYPIIEPDSSDSGAFDNVLEFMVQADFDIAESIMTMIPEAWEKNTSMPPSKRAFYKYNASRMEPWDGPACIIFTDGNCIGSILDRNGLRPGRYYLTSDDRCIMASEVGVLKVAPENIIAKGRLQPGKMFLVDFEAGRIVTDAELKTSISQQNPYAQWIAEQQIYWSDLAPAEITEEIPKDSVIPLMISFGYTVETLQFMLIPMVEESRDPLGSMGNDEALAVLSSQPRLLYDYFKQLFAQVTNPAIDSIREEVIMSLGYWIGPESNFLQTKPKNINRLWLEQPLLNNSDLGKLKHINHSGWRCQTLDITFPKKSGCAGFTDTLKHLSQQAKEAVAQGYSLLLLSDRNTSAERLPIPALLATGMVHQYLCQHNIRTHISIIVETGEAREVHQHCLLIGFGADAINPYLTYQVLIQAWQDGAFSTNQEIKSASEIVQRYTKAITKGMLKVIAKMGISTLQSYKGAQVFEAVGLAPEVIDLCFKGTPSRIDGIGFDKLYQEVLLRHNEGYPEQPQEQLNLPNPGQYHWRQGKEAHMWDPQAIAYLQDASRNNNSNAYKLFAGHVNQHDATRCTIRGLLKFKSGGDIGEPIDIDDVEPEASILKRFVTGAMSFGSISIETHETLAIAMNRINGKSNTGEGGENPERFMPMANGDLKRSAIKQIASGRFGVSINYLSNADELQIKIVQGAKPGEGGELPGHKVDQQIAQVRNSTPGIGLISPPPHHDIYSIEDIAQLIHDLKNANPEARISVKLGSEVGVGTIAAGVVKAKAEHLTISGHDGGTGASALTSIKHTGMPWELGMAETHQTLVLNNLRSRVVLQADGQLKTGRDVAIACMLGAEEFGFATAPLITLGCIMMRKCHLNTCPVGIATQDPVLRQKFAGQPEHVINYLFMVARELREIMATLGFKTITAMVGRSDMLYTSIPEYHWKANDLNLANLLHVAKEPNNSNGVYAQDTQDHNLNKALDYQLITLAEPALALGKQVLIELPVTNTNRVVGSMLSHAIIKRVGPQMLPDNSIHIKLRGSAGQSLAGWLAKGVRIEVCGDANDYVGKGLSGGQLIIYPPPESPFIPEENILIGNVALYGAICGEAYFRGLAAERFCIRNSGVTAVVEGVGDHGCEYMTGGRVLVLGATGRNFAAGMSGGIAYIFDKDKNFASNCNLDTVLLEQVKNDASIAEIHLMLTKHWQFTQSSLAANLLNNWPECLSEFVQVIPKDYKKLLNSITPIKTVAIQG